jgi:putative transposase
LQRFDLSKRTLADAATIERRSFVAVHAGDIWQGDVLYGPQISTAYGMRKTYLVSLLDDASRLITHCAFCLGETAVDIENVLKNAVLKRGVPKKLIVDNGAAYKSESLQSICARLQIRIIYCPAREPEGKGKLERYYRFFRETFLNEIDIKAIQNLADLNARLWYGLKMFTINVPMVGSKTK